jgi:hypothetical protein
MIIPKMAAIDRKARQGKSLHEAVNVEINAEDERMRKGKPIGSSLTAFRTNEKGLRRKVNGPPPPSAHARNIPKTRPPLARYMTTRHNIIPTEVESVNVRAFRGWPASASAAPAAITP